MAAKSKSKKPTSASRRTTPAKAKKATTGVSKKVSAKAKATAPKKPVEKKQAAPEKKAVAQQKLNDQKSKVKAKANLEESADTAASDDEFDPAAFFAASGGKGLFRAHIMRKERVDFNLPIRYRFMDGPLVYSADLLNLSKGGLCLRTPKPVKQKTILKVEIPLPHTSELFNVQAECIWSETLSASEGEGATTGLRFLAMSLAKQTVINNFIQQRRDELIMAKIGLDKFKDSVPVAGLD